MFVFYIVRRSSEPYQGKYTNILKDIPDLKKYPLAYIFEDMKLKHKPNTLWLEFGVSDGTSVNFISQFTQDNVYGFDSFEGLPENWRAGYEKGTFDRKGKLPNVNPNVVLIKGWFNDTLPSFIQQHKDQKISFLHIDSDLYSSAKFILNTLKDYLDKDCVVVFDELINYDGFDGENGELRAFYEFLHENTVDYEWIGMNGKLGMSGYLHENVALIIHSIH